MESLFAACREEQREFTIPHYTGPSPRSVQAAVSLLPQGEGDRGIIEKEACNNQAKYPCSDSEAIFFLIKDNNGNNQVEDPRHKASEEITPGPADAVYLGVQIK